MSISYPEQCRYAIASPTSMGVRITPDGRMPVHTANHFFLQATSAETNVMNVASSLGRECLALTKFVRDSPIARLIQNELRSRNISYEGISVEQGGPWGYRHQFNIADSGYGGRAPRVWNDRCGEVGCTLSADEFDLSRIFGQEGVAILHISGLIAALSPQTTSLCVELARAAKRYGTLVSFDLNYRASFWKGRKEELTEAFHNIASLADILIGNEEDFQLSLGLEGPEAGGQSLKDNIARFQSMITNAKENYPGTRVFATSLRQVISADEHLWGGLLLAEDTWYAEEPRSISVMDRIGGGDGFAGGILYGILSHWEPARWLPFGWAAGAMAAGSLLDYACPADEQQLWDIYAGNARVQR